VWGWNFEWKTCPCNKFSLFLFNFEITTISRIKVLRYLHSPWLYSCLFNSFRQPNASFARTIEDKMYTCTSELWCQDFCLPALPRIKGHFQSLLSKTKNKDWSMWLIVTIDSPRDQAKLSFPGCLGQACWIDCRSAIYLFRQSFPFLWACRLRTLIYCKKKGWKINESWLYLDWKTAYLIFCEKLETKWINRGSIQRARLHIMIPIKRIHCKTPKIDQLHRLQWYRSWETKEGRY
jgi:hypothetical protein